MPSTEALVPSLPDGGYNREQQICMLALVRYTIAQRLGLDPKLALASQRVFQSEQGLVASEQTPDLVQKLVQELAQQPKAAWWQQPAATFVTLTIDGQLRGCIGCLEAYQSLWDDLQSNAISAAFRDYRFASLTQAEFRDIAVEISVLTPSQPLQVNSEEQLLAQLRPGVDGLILQDSQFKATFLPQVWQQLPEPEAFVQHLKQKAGLTLDHWSQTMQCAVYQVQEIHE